MSEKSKTRCRGAVVAALLLVLVMIAELFTPAVAMAAGISDSSSAQDYGTVFEQGASTKSSGRVWSDKSVYAEPTDEFGTQLNLEEGENFNVVYSAMSSSEKISGKTDSALDVVFILDTSGSMKDKTSDGKRRIDAAIEALNHSLNTLLTDNPNNRVGVVTFATGAETLMPLANYEAIKKPAWEETIPGIWPGFGDEVIKHPASSDFISFDGKHVKAEWKGGSNSVDFAGGTNTQMGFTQGMNLLANEKETSSIINGKTVQRVPFVVMLSDGASTFSVKSRNGNWWNPSGDEQGPGNASYYGNGMLAMMNAAYKKQAIDQNYGVTDTKEATRVYTIGLGVGELEGNDKALAQITLNPTQYWDAKNDSINKNIRTQWDEYSKGKNIKVRIDRNQYYEAKHPSEGDITSLKYEDGYYETSNAKELDDVFENIVNDIITSSTDYPTDLKGGNAESSGYITYTDPIGEYMEVKNVKSIIYGENIYQLEGSIENGFHGTGTIKDPVTGEDVSLSGLTVTIQKDEEGNQTLVAKIPAAAIPLKVNEVKLAKDGSVESNTTVSNPSPIRIVYSIGMKKDIDKLEGVSNEYIEQHTENGKIYFYSNRFSGKTDSNGNTIGDAWTEFTPAKDNPNYYFQQDVTVYYDKKLQNPVKSSDAFDAATTYYIGTPYYDGNHVKQSLVKRTGDAFIDAQNQGYLVEVDGNWALKANTPRNYQIEQDFAKAKTENSTDTAEMLYSPSVDKQGYIINKIQFNHGNNGRMELDATGNLILKKTVRTEQGLTKPDHSYQFAITMPSMADRTVTAKLTNATGTVDQELTFDADGIVTNIMLKDGEFITIPYALGEYEIEEMSVGDGITVEKPDNSKGVIQSGKDTTVEFVNNYNPEPVVFPAEGESHLQVTKSLEGRKWQENDSFTFTMEPIGTYEPGSFELGATECTVTGTDSNKSASFGDITFFKPSPERGYQFLIKETVPKDAKDGVKDGIAYDTSVKRVAVKVDDDHNGHLVASRIDSMSDDLMFRNMYASSAVDFDGSVNLKVSKKLEGRPDDRWTEDDVYTFTLALDPDDTDTMVAADTITLPENAENLTLTKDQKTGAFGDIRFTETGTFKFVISEINTNVAGVTYDTTVQKITVVVTDNNDGTKTATTEHEGDFVFTNKYETTPAVLEGSANLNVNKTYVGKVWDDETFEFKLSTNASEKNVENGNQTITLTKEDIYTEGISGEGLDTTTIVNKAFSDIAFNKAGEYTFKIRETNGELSNVTYDDKVVTIKVNVYDNQKGALVAEVEEASEPLTFINTYTPKEVVVGPAGESKIELKKFLEGREMTANDKWSFTITKAQDTVDGTPMPKETTVQNDMSKVAFGNITYKVPGVYKYVITESGMVKGVMNDEVAYANVTVTITYDSETGKLEPTVTYDKQQFVNTYHVTPVVVPGATNFNVHKKLTGREWKLEDQFTFNMKADPEDPFTVNEVANGEIILPQNIEINGNSPDADAYKTNHFADMTFKKAGTYRFVITENQLPGISGVTFDDAKQKVVVNVVENKLDGTLNAVVSPTSVAFENIYKAADVTIEGKDAFAFSKVLEGREWTDSDQFTFKLTGEEDAPMPEKTEVLVSKPAKGNQAAFDFGDIQFTIEDLGTEKTKTFTYTVQEVAPETANGIAYDLAVRTVKITVTDDGTGVLKANVAIEGEKIFTNTYRADETYGEAAGETAFRITKNLKNHALAEGQFTFVITGEDERSKAKLDSIGGSNGVMEIVNGAAAVGEGETATWNARPFDSMTFVKDKDLDETGTYRFSVTEQDVKAKGYTCDTATHTVEIIVTDSKDGHLSIATNGYDVVFNNNYNADGTLGGDAEGAVKILATKTLNGRQMKNQEFQFEVVNVKNDEIVARGQNVAGQTNSPVVFGQIPYSLDTIEESGYENKTVVNGNAVYSFSYVVREVLPTAAGVTANTPKFSITVQVADDGQGNLVPTVIYPEGTGRLDFVNTYNADSVSLNIDATKELDTPEGAEITLEDISGKFEFVMEAAGAQYEPLKEEEKVETTKEPVEQPEEDTIETSKSIDADENKEAKEEENTDKLLDLIPKEQVTQKTTSVQPTVKPIVNPLPENAKAKNDAAGNVSFGAIHFDLSLFDSVQPDHDGKRTIVFTYKVTERNTVSGITNDPSAKTFTVTVTDDGEGHIQAQVNENEINALTFRNTYSFTPEQSSLTGSGQFAITKKLDGRDMKDAEFKFELKNMNNEVVAEGQNTSDGVVQMSAVEFTSPGTYLYTLSEVNGGKKLENGVQYDETVYHVSAHVKDAKNGHLEVTWEVPELEANELVFKNIYDPKATAVTLGANKILCGRDLKDGEFIFTLKDEDGKTLQTVKNDKDGRIQFEEIKYEQVGTWHYTIEEVKGTDKDIKYDDTEYKVTVNVIDDGIGFLRTEIVNENGAVIFRNSYEKPEQPKKPETPVIPGTSSTGPKGGATITAARTGDYNNMTLWSLLLMIAVVGAAGIIGNKKRKIG